MNWRVFLLDIPIAMITAALMAQIFTHYDLATDWRAALSAVGVGAASRLAPEALSMLSYYRARAAGVSPLPTPSDVIGAPAVVATPPLPPEPPAGGS